MFRLGLRKDIYSLGVILFEMLAGVRPYSANSAYEWIVLHMEATPPDLQQQYGVSPQLSRVVKRMLARQPALRQQSMREVLQDLRTAARGLKNIHAFSAEGTQLGPATSAALPTDIAQPPAPSPTASAPHTYLQPAAQPAAPQTYLKPATPPVQTQAYQPPVQAPAPVQSYLAPTPTYAPPPPQPYPQGSYMRPPEQNSSTPGRWRRIGEFFLGAAVVVIYLAIYWNETVAWFRNFLTTLKPSF